MSGVPNGKLLKMKQGEVPWFDKQYSIIEFPSYLKNGYFIQMPFGNISIGSIISVKTTGPAIIYVSTYLGIMGGGYSESLPKDSWSKQDGIISTYGNQLSNVFSRIFQNASTVTLPATTTKSTVMLIIVVPFCSGRLH